jgi:hypothetical protein
MKTFVVLTCIDVLAAACSRSQVQKGSTAETKERVSCWYEKPTGTRVKVKVCGTDSERAMALQDDRSRLDEFERQRSAGDALPGPMSVPGAPAQ